MLLISCFLPRTPASDTWHCTIRSTLSRSASVLASTVSVLMLDSAITFVFHGLDSTVGMPASSNDSYVFCHRLPVDSQTARDGPYFPTT